ncbi:cytochrome P450 [Burkholderia multivorans]|uniref:Cytochrome P450 n=1 Tax=Burkholderia multivorans TaxID=87883 RepID=A0AB37ATX8_9BURK|nr:cytochrome P450 [Burkholderia multivorans]MBU9346579.1 cytochrome P450 [Burkholderia multivorans]MCO1383873.1 cytochrome P450 [Burkholderia multivorans]MCO1400530.1 cytochrome P450 [Burkholderia multivorans]MDN7969749.1 cytochrome P450 [Burkholderia multivorans]PRE50417.1 cytochrome P450 [Burkholderia multivorans]
MTTQPTDIKCPFAHETFPWPRSQGEPLLPPPQYAALRERAPMAQVRLWDGSSVWLATDMESFREVMTSPHFSASPLTPGFPFVSPSRAAQSKSYQTFITMDPPEHGHYRRTLTKEFMAKRMQELRPLVQRSLDELLDDMERKGAPADFIEDVALPLPSLVISIMLGVPYEDRAKLQTWSANRLDLAASVELVTESARGMTEYIDQLLRQKEQDPGDQSDLLSRLAVEWINPGKVTHAEAVQMATLLYMAGHETTANQIGLGLLSLFQHPEQRAELAADPSLVRGAVEEMLRFHSITHMNSNRVATEDVMIGDQLVRKGEGVLALLHAANHDPAAFPDPTHFDIRRDTKDQSHVAFSFGIHQCLGQPLARLELMVVFETLFRRFPGLQLAIPADALQYKDKAFVYGLKSLPVKW